MELPEKAASFMPIFSGNVIFVKTALTGAVSYIILTFKYSNVDDGNAKG